MWQIDLGWDIVDLLKNAEHVYWLTVASELNYSYLALDAARTPCKNFNHNPYSLRKRNKYTFMKRSIKSQKDYLLLTNKDYEELI